MVKRKTKIEPIEYVQLDEGTASAATLHPGAGSNAGTDVIRQSDEAKKYLDVLRSVNKDDLIKRFNGYLVAYNNPEDAFAKTLSDYCAKNRKCIEAHNPSLPAAKAVEEELAKIHLPDDLKEKAMAMIWEVANSSDDRLREGLYELLASDPMFALMFDEEIDAVELLSSYGEYLEEQLAYVTECNLALQEEIKNQMLARHARLSEHLDLKRYSTIVGIERVIGRF